MTSWEDVPLVDVAPVEVPPPGVELDPVEEARTAVVSAVMDGAGLLRSDALRLPLRDESVDLVVTSPPYFALRSYQDGDEHYDGQIGSEPTPQAFLEALWAVTAECARVLKPSGSIFVNLGDKYAGSGGHNNNGLGASTLKGNGSAANPKPLGTYAQGVQRAQSTRRNAPDRYNQDSGGIPAKSLMLLPERYRIGCVDQLGLIARAVIIWDKPNGLPESVTDRVRRSHEDWVHLTKAPRYYAAVDEIREAYAAPFATRSNPGRNHNRNDGGGNPRGAVESMNPLGKLPNSVWEVATEPLRVPDWVGVDHFAAYPQELPRRFILGWAPSGVCRDCGFLLGSTYDYGVLGVRKADRKGAPQGQVGNRKTLQGGPGEVLQQDVLEPVECPEPGEHEVPTSDDTGLRGGLDAGPSDGTEERLPDGTPAGDGGAPGPPAGAGRGGSPQERGQDGQPDREPRAAGEDGSRPAAEATTEAVPVPSLRRSRPDIRELESCPHCGSGATRPSVILDPFGGTGTTALVARSLGRFGVSVDLSADYLRLARWRIWSSGHGSKAVSRTWRDRQESLFGEDVA